MNVVCRLSFFLTCSPRLRGLSVATSTADCTTRNDHSTGKIISLATAAWQTDLRINVFFSRVTPVPLGVTFFDMAYWCVSRSYHLCACIVRKINIPWSATDVRTISLKGRAARVVSIYLPPDDSINTTRVSVHMFCSHGEKWYDACSNKPSRMNPPSSQNNKFHRMNNERTGICLMCLQQY